MYSNGDPDAAAAAAAHARCGYTPKTINMVKKQKRA